MVRIKHRYLLAEIQWTKLEFTSKDLYHVTLSIYFEIIKALMDSVLINFGDFGISKVLYSLRIRYFNPNSRLVIIRCPREASDMV